MLEKSSQASYSSFSERSVNLKSTFSWNTIAQKTNEIFDKIQPYEDRAEFV